MWIKLLSLLEYKLMDFSRELQIVLQDLQLADDRYKPTAFWLQASKIIAEDLLADGVETFRKNIKCQSFFVPGYGPPIGNKLKNSVLENLKSQAPDRTKVYLGLEEWTSGRASAFADFRVLKAADEQTLLPHLHQFDESSFGCPAEQHEIEGRRFSRSSLNYLLGLVMLKKHISLSCSGEKFPSVVLEIGGGFGSLGEIMSQSGLPNWSYIDVDIPPINTVAEYYLRRVLGDKNVTGYGQTRNQKTILIENLPKATVLPSWQLPMLRGSIDLFVNYISFQEMEPTVVRNYLELVASLKPRWILLRNLKEGKQVRQSIEHIGVDKPILGDDYKNMLPSYKLEKRETIPFGYLTVDGFHSEIILLKKVACDK